MSDNGTPNGNLDAEISELEAANNERLKIQLWQMIGATKLANQVASSLSAQTLRALENVRDEQLYLVAGFETFDRFLDQHPGSPMSYEQFRRRVNLLKGEGDQAYDILSSLNVPLSQRKLLAGQIEVTDNEIKIGDASTRLDDGPRIVELISKLHLKTLEQQRTIDRGKKDNEKQKRRADEAEKRVVSINPTGTDSGQAFLAFVGAGQHLREALEAAPDQEKEALREQLFNHMSHLQLEISVAVGVITKDQLPADSNDDLNLTDAEAADLLGD